MTAARDAKEAGVSRGARRAGVAVRGPSILDGDVAAVIETVDRYMPEGISRADLRWSLAATYRRLGDSRMRVAIEEARLRGHLLIWDSTSRKYRIAASRAEFDGWATKETESRAGTLLRQLRAMRETADRTFPPQLRLGVA